MCAFFVCLQLHMSNQVGLEKKKKKTNEKNNSPLKKQFKVNTIPVSVSSSGLLQIAGFK